MLMTDAKLMDVLFALADACGADIPVNKIFPISLS
jgi:hypothetical protein